MTPRVHTCPRCGAPLDAGAAGRVECKFCGAAIDLGSDAWLQHYDVSARPSDRERAPVTPEDLAERGARSRNEGSAQGQAGHGHAHAHGDAHAHGGDVSPLWGRLKLVSGPILAIAAGFLAVQSVFVFLRNGGEPRVIFTAILQGIVVIALAASGRTIQSAIVAAFSGALFVAKPFVRPVFMRDGGFFGTTSETHLNYLVPGVLLLVAAAIVAMTFKKQTKPWRPRLTLALLGAAGFAAGVAIAIPGVAGESINDALTRYRPRFEAMRSTWKAIDAKLPPPGSVTTDKVQKDLKPQPIGGAKYHARTNTEFVPADLLADPDGKASYDLIVSGDLFTGMLWTGPKNPMSESVLYNRAGDFVQKLDSALEYRYLVVYRPLGALRASSTSPSTGSDGIEAFVFDLKTTELVASFHSAKAGSFSEGRETLARGLERVTGGLFDFQ